MTVRRHNPDARLVLCDGTWWHEDPEDPEWIMLGFAPTPTTVPATIRYNILHGLLMRYPLIQVLRWSWQHRVPKWDRPEPTEPEETP